MGIKRDMMELAMDWKGKNLKKVMNQITPKEFLDAYGILDKQTTRRLIYKRYGVIKESKTLVDLALSGDIDDDWLYVLDIPYLLTIDKTLGNAKFIGWVLKNSGTWLKMRDNLVNAVGYKEKYERWGVDRKHTSINVASLVKGLLNNYNTKQETEDFLGIMRSGVLLGMPERERNKLRDELEYRELFYANRRYSMYAGADYLEEVDIGVPEYELSQQDLLKRKLYTYAEKHEYIDPNGAGVRDDRKRYRLNRDAYSYYMFRNMIELIEN